MSFHCSLAYLPSRLRQWSAVAEAWCSGWSAGTIKVSMERNVETLRQPVLLALAWKSGTTNLTSARDALEAFAKLR